MEEEPIRKPRQLRGTPAYRYTFKLSTYVVGGSFALSMVLMYFNQDRLYRKIAAGYYDASKYMKQKRRMMSNFTPSPNVYNRPIREYETQSMFDNDDAESTLDADLR